MNFFKKEISCFLGLLMCFGLLAKSEIVYSKTKNSKNPPNIVFILVDDLGWSDLACYGSDFYETPNLDLLASEGIKFTNAYASCPVCSPTRASILTGKYPARLDITDWIPGRQATHAATSGQKLLPQDFKEEMSLEEYTVAEALKDNNYKTFFAGKWHLGEGSTYWPEYQGFDINKGGWKVGSPKGGYFSPYLNPRLQDGPEGEYLTDRLTDESINFLKDNKKNPFFLYLSYYTVHNPLNAKPKVIEKYRKKAKQLGINKEDRFVDRSELKNVFGKGRFRERLVQDHAVYAAMVESMDENIGRLLQQIKALNLDDNTLIIFTSDNGGLSTSEGSPTSNLPLRGGKGWLYEGGIREPLIVKWNGITKRGSVCETAVTSADFYPTILDVVGLQALPQQHPDGISLVPLLQDQDSLIRDAIYWHYPHYSNQGGRPGGAIRSGKYKLIEFYEDMHVELYDLQDDMEERVNLANKYPKIVLDLKSKLHRWREEIHAKMPMLNPEYQP
ncbi:sulfatase [Labilibaculum sp. DW002]|uniref:Sulfatase n=1 Tax=Paralabilibaculum antarcticum TaxID=2912572 RepID=A0ABT5VMU0_9BACT|nr:sulfatase [Labilibaculum sp. DW002]MDE5416749.1 sulfatase [Labilibaculum sp. DW002]